jgi:hypothetical protein
MPAPGQNLEFGESKVYRRKVETVEGLRDWILKNLRAQPHEGTAICGPLRRTGVAVGGKDYELVFWRRGQQIRLLDIFWMPREKADLEDYLVLAKELFCGGSR